MDFDSQCYTAYMVTAAGTELGPNALCGIYPRASTTPVKRTLGWHILTIAAGTTSTEIAIDGQTVFVGPVCYFDTIQFVVSGPLRGVRIRLRTLMVFHSLRSRIDAAKHRTKD